MEEILNSKLEVTWSSEEKLVLDAALALAEEGLQASYINDVLLFLHQHTQATIIMIAREFETSGEMTSLGLLLEGNLSPQQITYKLAGTPCEHVQKHQISYLAANAHRLFPAGEYLVTYQIESYMGAPLLDQAGNIIGLVTIMHQEPLANPSLIELLLTILSPSLESSWRRTPKKH